MFQEIDGGHGFEKYVYFAASFTVKLKLGGGGGGGANHFKGKNPD